MNPVLVEIYSTVIPSMPFIIAAYALLWAVLLIYVFVSMRGMKKTEQQIAVLEEAVAELTAKSPACYNCRSESTRRRLLRGASRLFPRRKVCPI